MVLREREVQQLTSMLKSKQPRMAKIVLVWYTCATVRMEAHDQHQDSKDSDTPSPLNEGLIFLRSFRFAGLILYSLLKIRYLLDARISNESFRSTHIESSQIQITKLIWSSKRILHFQALNFFFTAFWGFPLSLYSELD